MSVEMARRLEDLVTDLQVSRDEQYVAIEQLKRRIEWLEQRLEETHRLAVGGRDG